MRSPGGQADVLVSARCGVIRRVSRRTLPPGFPPALRYWAAELADTRAWGWTSDAAGGGCTWWDDHSARLAAEGEAVEHLCGSLAPGELIQGSASDLARAGFPVLDPATLALFAPWQYEAPGFPFVPFDRDLTVRWMWGLRLRDRAPALIPASLVLTGYMLGANPGAKEPLTNPPIHAGIAAGRSFDASLTAALLEVIERDSVWRCWAAGGITLQRLAAPRWLEAVAAGERSRFLIELFAFPNEFDLPVVGALVSDRTTGVRLLGTACRRSWTEAALKAVAEGFQLQAVANELLDPGSPVYRLASQGGALKPWRPERDFRAAYRPDWRDARDQLCHVQLYLDPAMGPLLDSQLAAARSGPCARAGAKRDGTPLDERFSRAGFDVFTVDLTTADVRAAGMTVIRALVPGMYSNAPAAFPFLGGRRLPRPARAVPPLPYA